MVGAGHGGGAKDRAGVGVGTRLDGRRLGWAGGGAGRSIQIRGAVKSVQQLAPIDGALCHDAQLGPPVASGRAVHGAAATDLL